jgi:hypothetical protein
LRALVAALTRHSKASAIAEAFLFTFTPTSEAFMDIWIDVHIDKRREELYADAARARIIRMLESGRSTGIRGRIAEGAESASNALANFARRLRIS